MSAKYEVGFSVYGKGGEHSYLTHEVECDFLMENDDKVMFFNLKPMYRLFPYFKRRDHVATFNYPTYIKEIV